MAVLKISRDPFVYKKSSARQRTRAPAEQYFDDLARHCSEYVSFFSGVRGRAPAESAFWHTSSSENGDNNFGCFMKMFPHFKRTHTHLLLYCR